MFFLFRFRGKTSFDSSGVVAEKPDDVKQDDSEFDLYRKRMMLAYKFRPNPLVSMLAFLFSFSLGSHTLYETVAGKRL